MHSAKHGARRSFISRIDAATIGAVVGNRFFTSASTFDDHASAR